MPAFSINEGYSIRKHPSGAWIYMSQKNPGVYYDAQGNVVEAKKAREAGFDIDKNNREASKQKALEEARKRIEREHSEAFGDLSRVVTAAEEGEVSVRRITGGKYAVFDKNSRRLTEKGLTKTEADTLVATATGAGKAESAHDLDEPALEG